MRPVSFDFRTPPGGTPQMGVLLYGRDPRTKAVARLPLPGTTVEWTVNWPDGEKTLDQFSGLQVDRRSGAIIYPISAARAALIEGAVAPVPMSIRLRTSDGAAYPFLTGTLGFGDPAPMSNTVLAPDLTIPSIDALPRVEPYLVGIVMPYAIGAADEAVAAAVAIVESRLAQPDLGEALAKTPGTDEDSSRVATAAMVQAVRRALVEQATAIAEAAVVALVQNPDRLRSLLAANLPDGADRPTQGGVPWLNGDVVNISPDTAEI